MEETTRGARWKWGLTGAVIAWIVAAIHGFVHSDMAFMTQLFQPSGAELWLRILTAAVAVWLVLKVRTRLDEQDAALAHESAERTALNSAAEQAGLAIMTLDDSLQIQWANDRVRALTGLVMNNLLGSKFPEALVADESQEDAREFLNKARRGATASAQLAMKSKRDVPLVVNCSSSVLHDAKTDSRHIVLFFQSVSDLVQEKMGLQRQLASVAQALGSTQLLTAHLDADGQVRHCSQALAEAGSLESGAEAAWDALFQNPADDALQTAWEDAVGGLEQAVDTVLADGREVLVRFIPLMDDTDEAESVWMVAEDKTLRSTALEDLEQQLAEVKERARVLEEEKQTLSESRSQLAERVSRLEDELKAAKDAEDGLIKEKQELEAAREALEKDLEDKSAQLADAERQRDSLREANDKELQELRAKAEREMNELRAQSEAEAGRWKQAAEKSAKLAHENLLSSSMPLLLLGEDGQISECNAPAKQLLEDIAGTPSLNGRSFASLLPSEARGTFMEKMEKVFAGDTAEPQLLHLTRDNGSRVTLVCSLNGFRGDNGVSQAVLMAHDVSDMQDRLDELTKAANNQQFELSNVLEEAEWERDRCNVILRSITEGILVTDVYHRVVLMNRAAEDILGVRLSDVLQRPVSFAVPERYFRTELEKTLDQRLSDNCFSLTLSQGDGELELDVSTNAVKNQNSKGMAVVSRLVRQ